MIIQIIRKIFQIFNSCFYCLFYRKLSINPIKSHFSGDVYIKNNGAIFIGDYFRSRNGVTLNVNGGSINIGKNVFFNRYVSLNCMSHIFIGNNVLIGESSKLYDHDHDFRSGPEEKNNKFVHQPIKVGNNVWIGSNVVILKGVTIGDNSVIGAGCIVTRDVPANSVLIQKRHSTYIKIIK
ncbi:acyltransferase [Escherichia coli]|uniref:acyltransferase n=1 Tax=Escherichia coli TaxID=562 RepID=UPI0010AC71B9|nr:acyltransferase [Escherichia coli]TJF76332.1 acyltransferase [Escherichia coli]